MHGRLKVRTTEEEKARKEKEQALKVKAYRAAMTKIQAKRGRQELDDEMLTLTAQILQRNPDVATLWNIRRECILKKTNELDEQEARQAVFNADLGLTEQCLMVNPKSYAGWHQRCWVLENCPQANWKREVQLCDKYLKLDERNFHTWDYRRYVVAKAGVGKQQELDFCTDLIRKNFSNYSSWHYRSQLLPALYPCEEVGKASRPLTEQKLKEELEMVLTAAFTDPNDSSAWFYQRWLLGNSRPELDVCAFRVNSRRAVLAFTKPISRRDFEAVIKDETAFEKLTWKALHGTPNDTTWVAAVTAEMDAFNLASNSDHTLHFNIPNCGAKQLKLTLSDDGFCYFKPPNFSLAFSAAVITELETQLESCNSLLEFEPDSKWTLLTSSLLMRAIDRRRYHTKSLEHLQKLQEVDELRRGYYKDLAAKWVMEMVLEDWHKSEEFPTKLDLSGVDQLSAVCCEQYLSVADAIELPDKLKDAYMEGKQKLYSFTTAL